MTFFVYPKVSCADYGDQAQPDQHAESCLLRSQQLLQDRKANVGSLRSHIRNMVCPVVANAWPEGSEESLATTGDCKCCCHALGYLLSAAWQASHTA
jgi:hypothetical protein